MDNSSTSDPSKAIAIIGLACRFPGAKDQHEFWRNLENGVESITFFSDEELREAGVPAAILRHPEYVKAAPVLDRPDLFDASFFGLNPREAELMDPQQRLFLECAWEALEDAGCVPDTYPGSIGIYASASWNTYLINSLCLNRSLMSANAFQIFISNDKDFMPTRVSYRLNLRGPSLNVQTACSSSLVAVHLACESLLNGECDTALVGAVTVKVPVKEGYQYLEGGIASRDGHCRAFDAQAQGTVFGSGLGVVVLKRLEEALAERDPIYAVIKGWAINNDGALKASYTAPSVNGQAEVIVAAQTLAGISPETITYIEAHGTGTPLGDPIEVAALTKAFRGRTHKIGFCALGSVKTNIGHLDTAAGMAGLIKTVLALKHKRLPPSLHFNMPNPKIDFASSPFYVNARLQTWSPPPGVPRRAGVSSFGVGGTNAHVLVEEAPVCPPAAPPAHPWQVLPLSARTDTALDMAARNLAEHFREASDVDLPAVAYTLQVGRKAFSHRRAVVCREPTQAIAGLEGKAGVRVFQGRTGSSELRAAFLVPGQGLPMMNMGRGLYQVEPVFREAIDRGSELVRPAVGLDLRTLLYPAASGEAEAARLLKATWLTQPALFILAYALAQVWMHWGVRPYALLGHSLGEYVAACLAGVMTLEEALQLVAVRGRLMQDSPEGAMLVVPLASEEVMDVIGADLALAAINGPRQCVVSGSVEAIERYQAMLQTRGVVPHRLATERAFHSPLMESVLKPFRAEVARVTLQPPQVRYISNVTGTWIEASQATDPDYWVKHLREPVQFARGLQMLLSAGALGLVEAGPGQVLQGLAHQQGAVVVGGLRRGDADDAEMQSMLEALAQLWVDGLSVDWKGVQGAERQRVSLPPYPFERQRYWNESSVAVPDTSDKPKTVRKHAAIADWFYLPLWKQTGSVQVVSAPLPEDPPATWLVFEDRSPLIAQLSERLTQAGQIVVRVMVGDSYTPYENGVCQVRPGCREDYQALLADLARMGQLPNRVVHTWGRNREETPVETAGFDSIQERGFYSLLYLVQALGHQRVIDPIHIDVILSGVCDVTGSERLFPARAAALAICKVMPQEYPNLTCRAMDVLLSEAADLNRGDLLDQVWSELHAKSIEGLVAYRGPHRWIQGYEPVRIEASAPPARLRPGGTYLITGELGRHGLILARYLAQHFQANLVLMSRAPLPDKNAWPDWLATHDEQDHASWEIRQLQGIEALGAQVMVGYADVTRLDDMRALVLQARSRFGALHGVIHAAGIAGNVERQGHLSIQEMDAEKCEYHFRPKARSLDVLEQLIEELELDFCLLNSSISAVLGGLGLVAYSAANHVVDVFTRKHNRDARLRWLSINWESWNMLEHADQSSPGSSGLGATLAELSLTPDEAGMAFERALGLAGLMPQLVVSSGVLQTRLDQWVRRGRVANRLDDASNQQALTQHSDSKSRHARPPMKSPYLAPRSETERRLAEIWQAVLGVEQIGVQDDYFDLGGESLLAIQLMHHIRQEFRVEIPFSALFNGPTVADLAQVIDEVQTARNPQILEMIEALSDEETSLMIEQLESGRPAPPGTPPVP